MGTVDDILGSPPDGLSGRELHIAFWRSVCRILGWGTAVIVGVPLALLLVVLILY